MSEQHGWQCIEDFDTYQDLERLCDEVWRIVVRWAPLARETVGSQLIRAVDSVGANLVEGDGRYHYKEKLHFCYVARASLREARYWIRRAYSRQLIADAQANEMESRLTAIAKWISTLIAERRRWASQVREEPLEYHAE